MTFSATDFRRLIVDDDRSVDMSEVSALLDSHGTPILTDDPARPDHQRALFLWVADPTDRLDGVYVWVNRLTDKRHVDAGVMRRRPGSSIWWTELTVPRGTMAGYRIYPFTVSSPGIRDGRVEYSREIVRQARPDPHNLLVRAGSSFASVLRTDGSPDLSMFTTGSDGHVAEIQTGALDVDGTVLRYRIVGADTPAPTDLLLVFDAEKWFDRHHLPAVLTAANDGSGRSFTVIGVDSPADSSERLRVLGGNRPVIDAIAGLVGRCVHEMPTTPTRIVVAGQSLGGLAALTLAAWHPGLVDEVLAYSPSVWWRPGLRSRPAQVGDPQRWIHDQLRDAADSSTEIRLAAGQFEEELAPNVAGLAETVEALGHPTSFHLYPGGHDDAWWAALLLADLTAVPNPVRSNPSPR